MGTKIEELVVYISKKSKNDPNFGSTKLNKILFASDFFHYGYFGSSISGVKYVHRDRGPAPLSMKPVLESLAKAGRIKIEEVERFGYIQKRVNSLSEPDMSSFSGDEIEFIDMIIGHFKDWNGTELSNWTHKLIPWLATSEGEEIPYESIFVLNDLPVDQDGINWARSELKQLRDRMGYAH
jgi:hypothetical protein